MKEMMPNKTLDWCGISSTDDFKNYEHIISFKFKIINKKRQLSKICDFISDHRKVLDYDWYIKIRPDIMMLEPLNFDLLKKDCINARSRQYTGPKKILWGTSINGEGIWRHVQENVYDEIEKVVILDDMLYIFDFNVIKTGGFDKIDKEIVSSENENEWYHATIWNNRNISLNIIGIYLNNCKYNAKSGSLNIH
jgi:hypothetical protein